MKGLSGGKQKLGSTTETFSPWTTWWRIELFEMGDLGELRFDHIVKRFHSEIEPEGMKWRVLHMGWGKLNLRTERVIPHKCLIYRKRKHFWPMNLHQEFLPILNNKISAWTVVSHHFLEFLAHKYSLPQILRELTCSLYSFHVPNCNSSGVPKSPQCFGHWSLYLSWH